MSFSRAHNIGGHIGSAKAIDNTNAVAAGAGDNTEIVGQIIDTTLYKHPLSVAILVPWKAVLAATKTLTLKSVKLEHGDDSGLSDAANLVTPADVIVGTGAATLHGCQQYNVDLAGCKRYIRLKVTPDLSATATDTADVAAAFVFGGQDKLS